MAEASKVSSHEWIGSFLMADRHIKGHLNDIQMLKATESFQLVYNSTEITMLFKAPATWMTPPSLVDSTQFGGHILDSVHITMPIHYTSTPFWQKYVSKNAKKTTETELQITVIITTRTSFYELPRQHQCSRTRCTRIVDLCRTYTEQTRFFFTYQRTSVLLH